MQAFWTPSQDRVAQATLTRFKNFVNERHGLSLQDYRDLHSWSTGTPQEINDFWTAIWDFTGIVGDKGPAPLFDASKDIHETSETMDRACVNWAENMLLSHDAPESQPAVIACVEPDQKLESESARYDSVLSRTLTFGELRQEVAQAASALRKAGVGPGDRVAAFIPNNAEAIVMVLATSAVGATWSSSAPEFGVTAVLDRFTQFKPKILLAADRYRAQGKEHDVLGKLNEIAPALVPHGLEKVVLVGQLQRDRRPKQMPSYDELQTIAYPDLLDKTATDIEFHRASGNAPLWVLYSSGTTGKPKAIIHNQLGMIFAMKLAGPLHSEYKTGDCQLQITTTGWMMWNQMVNHLSLGMTVIAYDGSPILRTNKTILFDLLDRFGATSFSLSPRYLQILQQDGVKPKDSHSLQRLSSIFSAGSPLTWELYAYIRDYIRSDIFIHNGSGGTDLCNAFIGACPILPMYAGRIQVPLLGFAVEAAGEDGYAVKEGLGDMVIAKPVPNMPLGLLGDEDRSLLKSTYFSQYPQRKVWYHADFIEMDEYGIVMHGRSDGVLNPQGVRFGSAEIYRIIEKMQDPSIQDCIAIGQKKPDADERVILFIKPQEGKEVDDALVARITKAISSDLSRRHVPAKILQCPDIPYTTNGKRVEVAVKKVINGAHPGTLNTSALANPDSLDFFFEHPELRFPDATQASAAAAAAKA